MPRPSYGRISAYSATSPDGASGEAGLDELGEAGSARLRCLAAIVYNACHGMISADPSVNCLKPRPQGAGISILWDPSCLQGGEPTS